MWALVDRELSVTDLAEHVGKLAPRYRSPGEASDGAAGPESSS
jgi:hypothetical protein